MFCANCRLIFQQDFPKYPSYPGAFIYARHNYTIPYKDFLLASTKCHCCYGILCNSKLDQRSTVSDEEELKFRFRWDYKNPEGILSRAIECHLYVSVSFCKSKYRSSKKRAFAKASFTTQMPDWYRGTGEQDDFQLRDTISDTPIDSTGSDYTARFIKICLERCKFYHTKCHTDSKAAPWYPTRLIEVLDDGSARVLETAETTPTGPYATLSHCWGSSPGHIFTATTTNIDFLKRQIPLAGLPKTFRDALLFTQKIGISFIWIDSICIIQDSVKDWEFESRTMLQVYRHAECNLAAAVSVNSHGGLFSHRDHAILPSGWFEAQTNVPELNGLHCAVPEPDRHVWWNRSNAWLPQQWQDAFTKEIGSSRLASRGWIYQERAVSKRVVAFGRDQVFWDCSERLESDILPGYHIGHYNQKWSKISWKMAVPKHRIPTIPRTIESLDDGLRAWQSIANQYSACDFTFMKDKPVAILGVAEMMSSVMANEPHSISTSYWAGLWLQEMNRQLLWTFARPGLRQNNHAPSWSWLSIEGPINWKWPDSSSWGWVDSREMSPLATIARPGTQPVDSNSKFCEISSDLKIWCSLHAVQVPAQDSRRGLKRGFATQQGDEEAYNYDHCDCDNVIFNQDWASKYVSHVCSPNLVFKEQINCQLYSIRFDTEDINLDHLYFLPLTLGPKDKVGGIIIQPADHPLGVYRRCGRARVSRPWTIQRMPYDEGRIEHAPGHEMEDARFAATFDPLRKDPSGVDFVYEKYDAELGYLVHLV